MSDQPAAPHPRSGPFAWSPLGNTEAGYVVASFDHESPVIDVVLVDGDARPAWTFSLSPDDARRLASQLGELMAQIRLDDAAKGQVGRLEADTAVRHETDVGDRKLTTMGGLALALGIATVFWAAVGIGIWLLLR